jgi:uncharacterized membrane protein YbhN (UPF0104 family)
MLIGYLANNVLPARLGEFLRALSLADREGGRRSAILGTVLVERLLDVTALGVAVLFGVVVIVPSPLMTVAAATGLGLGLSGLALFAIVGGKGRHEFLMDRLPTQRFRSAAQGMRHGLAVVRRPSMIAPSVVLTAVAWAITALAFAAAADAVGIHLNFGQAFVMAAGVNLATAIPAGPGYFGTFELAALSISAALGLTPSAGLAAGLIVHGVALVLTSATGITSAALLHVVPGVLATQARESSEMVRVAADAEVVASVPSSAVV